MHIQNHFKRLELALKFSGYEHTQVLLQDLALIYKELREHNNKLFHEDDPNLFPLDYFKTKGK